MSTDKQIGQFHEQGYLILEKLIDGEKAGLLHFNI